MVSSTVAVLPVPGTPDTYRHRPPLLPVHHHAFPVAELHHNNTYVSVLTRDLLWAEHGAADRRASPR